MNYQISIYLVILVLAVGCSRAFDPQIRTGAHPQLGDGVPEVMFSALAYLDDDNQPVIDTDLDIRYGSLIYRESDGIFTAGVEIQTEVFFVIDASEEEYERVEVMRDTIHVEDGNRRIIDSHEQFSHSDRIPVRPGNYRVVARVTDLNSDQAISRSSNTTVFDPESATPNLTHIKVYGGSLHDPEVVFPLTSYSIPGMADTLTFEYQVTRPPESGPLRVTMQLRQFESDTLPPRRMSAVTPTRGSLQYRGINYNRSEVLESQERILEQETGTITIEYRTSRPSRGNYRFEVEISEVGEDDDPIAFKARDFGSMSNNFPDIVTPRELAKPLVYLMRQSDYREMMSIEDSDSLKRAIDRFWLSHLGNKDQARRVIEMYYERVEEANKQFSNFKEGWMTDMGMMYILFGPPWYVERSLDRMVWIYGYNRNDPRRVFHFQRTRMHSDTRPFEHYILQRHTQYHGVEYEQVQRWLSGAILTRPI